jgi:hypothetical protein
MNFGSVWGVKMTTSAMTYADFYGPASPGRSNGTRYIALAILYKKYTGRRQNNFSVYA